LERGVKKERGAKPPSLKYSPPLTHTNIYTAKKVPRERGIKGVSKNISRNRTILFAGLILALFDTGAPIL